jgi:hypothetical protein
MTPSKSQLKLFSTEHGNENKFQNENVFKKGLSPQRLLIVGTTLKERNEIE